MQHVCHGAADCWGRSARPIEKCWACVCNGSCGSHACCLESDFSLESLSVLKIAGASGSVSQWLGESFSPCCPLHVDWPSRYAATHVFTGRMSHCFHSLLVCGEFGDFIWQFLVTGNVICCWLQRRSESCMRLSNHEPEALTGPCYNTVWKGEHFRYLVYFSIRRSPERTFWF